MPVRDDKKDTSWFRFYCICGMAWAGTVEPIARLRIKELFEEYHSGPGHEPCTAEEAFRVRYNKEKIVNIRRR